MAKNFQKKKCISYNLATIFSGEKVGSEYQMVKVGFYDEKLTFNFYKGTAGSANKMQEAFVKFDYETATTLVSVLETIIRNRVATYREGSTYVDNVNCNYAIRYTDSESQQLRTLGNLTLCTEAINERYGMVLKYNDGKDEYRIVLASPTWIGDSFSMGEESFIHAEVDIFDSRLYAFSYLLSNMIKSWPILVQQDTIARYQMARLVAIAEKLGISNNNNGNGGRYNNNNYRSSPNSNNAIPQNTTSTSVPNVESDFGEGEEPF